MESSHGENKQVVFRHGGNKQVFRVKWMEIFFLGVDSFGYRVFLRVKAYLGNRISIEYQ
jgi:hypothetical protein